MVMSVAVVMFVAVVTIAVTPHHSITQSLQIVPVMLVAVVTVVLGVVVTFPDV